MTDIRRAWSPSLVALPFVLTGVLLTGDASAQGQSQTRRPQSPGQSAERRRPDNPRVPQDAPAQPPSAMPSSGDYRIDALLSGYRWGSGSSGITVTYSFYENSVFGGTYYGSENVSEVSEQVKTNVRAVMAWYSTIMNVNFVEVVETNTSTFGVVRIMDSTAPSYAYAYYPSSSHLGGDVHLNSSYDRLGDTNGFQHPAGEHGYTTLIHEIGHAIGLKHPHDGSPRLPSAEDNHTRTVMSYGFPGESPGTPMAYDVMALQYVYGARSYRTLGDAYQFSRAAIDQYSLGGQLFISPTLTTKQVIWDSGGYNVLDLSGFTASTSGYRLDLNPLGWLSTNANYLTTYLNAGMVIGPGVGISQLVNSGSSDTIYANALANVFSGYSSNRVTGSDVIYGATTADTIDLSGYVPGQVFESVSGNDKVLSFGENGSIRLKDYYVSPDKQPAITYSTVTPQVSVADVSVTEGDATTTATFVVTLTAPGATPQEVNFATSDGTAIAGSDYVAASGTITFAAGETSKTVSITIIGDTTQEADEAFIITLSNPVGGLEIADAVATGTILNDDLPPNTAPTAVLTVSSTSGVAPLVVNFSSAGSFDPDGTIASYAWTFGNGASSTQANPSYTYTTPGTFTVSLTVTDNRGATSVRTASIIVSQNPASVLHIGHIVMSKTSAASGTTARATVTVVNNSGQAVAGVTVTARWSGVVTGTATGTTATDGTVVLLAKATKKKGSATISITEVTKSGFTYDSGANVETTDTIAVP
jgi:PKD repeat protein